ncbi:MAG: DciA family protein [Coleofasciculus sp. A1-SPW-01]|uniref:DUF721 domain-containing protein n=1 Tax=Coleofasciculus sp. A1-SPW-01 TaxID=3070819 RepID=UPI003302F19B
MLKSLNHIVEALDNQPFWQGQKQFQQIRDCWADVVGADRAQQTRPHSLSRSILYVATSSSVWSQDLSLNCRSILKQLNARLSTPIETIRFSPGWWYQEQTLPQTEESEHPSLVDEPEVSSSADPPVEQPTPQTAFEQWAAKIKARSQNLPLCPQCHCPTPPGELKRWHVCGLCATKQWQG